MERIHAEWTAINKGDSHWFRLIEPIEGSGVYRLVRGVTTAKGETRERFRDSIKATELGAAIIEARNKVQTANRTTSLLFKNNSIG